MPLAWPVMQRLLSQDFEQIDCWLSVSTLVSLDICTKNIAAYWYIAGLQPMLQQPCWWTRPKEFPSTDNYTIFCGNSSKNVYYFVHYAGLVVTWLETKNFSTCHRVKHMKTREDRPLKYKYGFTGADPGTCGWGVQTLVQMTVELFCDLLIKHRRPHVSQSVNTFRGWCRKYCFASRGKQIMRIPKNNYIFE